MVSIVPAVSIETSILMSPGSYLSLAWSTGDVQVIDAKLGKVAFQYPVDNTRDQEVQPRPSTFITSGTNLLDPSGIELPLRSKQTARTSKTGAFEDNRGLTNGHAYDFSENPADGADDHHATLEDFTARIADRHLFQQEIDIPDLPRRLSQITVEDQLPRLSALPPGDESSYFDYSPDAFTSQERLDVLFAPFQPAGTADTVNVSYAHTPSGRLVFHIYDDFFAGEVAYNDESAKEPSRPTILAHASNPFSTIHANLIQTANQPLAVQLLDFTSVSDSRYFLPLIVNQTAALKHTTDYIAQTVLSLRTAWAACQDLPQRWLAIGEEDVSSQHSTSLPSALYALAITGDCLPALREWLTHTIGERNYKRWESATSSNYHLIIDLLHRHLLPAVDHASLRASRLRSLARTPDLPIFPIDARHLSRVLNDLDVLRPLAHRLLQHTRLEAAEFATFAPWLKHTIAAVAAEPGSQSAADAADKAAALDPAPLLRYLTGALTHSRLPFFLARPTQDILAAPRRPAQQTRPLLLAQVLDRHARHLLQPAGPVVEVANLLFQACFLRDSVADVIRVVPRGFARGVHLPAPIPILGARPGGPVAVRLVVEAQRPVVHALASVDGRLHLVRLEPGAATPTLRPVAPALDGVLVDAKFLDDGAALALVRGAEASSLVCVATGAGVARVVVELRHAELGFVPGGLGVAKEKSRVRVLLVAEDRRRYAVLLWTGWEDA